MQGLMEKIKLPESKLAFEIGNGSLGKSTYSSEMEYADKSVMDNFNKVYANREEIQTVVKTVQGSVDEIDESAAKEGGEATQQGNKQAIFQSGRNVEAEKLSKLNIHKNNTVFRPSEDDINSAAFNVIVGDAKYIKSGVLKGTIFDSVDGANIEIKSGKSVLSSSYQIRLQLYRSVTTNTQYILRTSSPVTQELQDIITRWGGKVEGL